MDDTTSTPTPFAMPTRGEYFALPILGRDKSPHVNSRAYDHETAKLCEDIVRNSTYPVSRDLAFHAIPIDKTVQSHVIGLFTCNVSDGDSTIADAFRWGFAEAVITDADTSLRQIIARATQPGATESAETRVFKVVRSMYVTYIPSEKATGPMWAVYMAPCTTDHAMWDQLRGILRSRIYTDDVYSFTPIGYKAGQILPAPICHLCKLGDHLSHVCRFKRTWGPEDVITAATTGTLALPVRRQPNRGRGRGRGGNN